MSVQIDNVGIAIVCKRIRLSAKTTTRTFKARCGSYTRFVISEAGTILSISHEHNACKSECEICTVQSANAKKLIQSGK